MAQELVKGRRIEFGKPLDDCNISQFLIYGHSISVSEVVGEVRFPTMFVLSIGISATFLPIFFRESTSEFTYVQRSVYLVGSGGVLVFFGALVSFATTLPDDKLTLWPLVIVLGIPILICYVMFVSGIESSRILSERASSQEYFLKECQNLNMKT